MGTNVIQVVKSALQPYEIANNLSSLLVGRNVAPDETFDRYVVNTVHNDSKVSVELDDGTIYEITIRRVK